MMPATMLPAEQSQNFLSRVHIFIDADSFPVAARQLVLRVAQKRALPVYFVANRLIPLPAGNEVHMIKVRTTADAADHYICGHVGTHDIVLTRDILLAERLTEQGIAVMNHLGQVFDKQNVRERRSQRDFSLQAHHLGLIPAAGKSTYNNKDLSQLANSLDRLLTAILKLCGQS